MEKQLLYCQVKSIIHLANIPSASEYTSGIVLVLGNVKHGHGHFLPAFSRDRTDHKLANSRTNRKITASGEREGEKTVEHSAK